MTGVGGTAWTVNANGVTVRVRVTPKSSRDAVEGIETTPQGDALKIRVRAVPDKGAANVAVAETLAHWIGVPKSTVLLVSGSTARVKVFSVAGDGAALTTRISQRLHDERG